MHRRMVCERVLDSACRGGQGTRCATPPIKSYGKGASGVYKLVGPGRRATVLIERWCALGRCREVYFSGGLQMHVPLCCRMCPDTGALLCFCVLVRRNFGPLGSSGILLGSHGAPRAKGIRKIWFLLPLALARADEVMVCPANLAAYGAKAMLHTNVHTTSHANGTYKCHIHMSPTNATWNVSCKCRVEALHTNVMYKCPIQPPRKMS